MEKLQQLHIPNVLYQEGIKFFGAVPRVGAYYVVPITIQTIPPQVVALLCVDTLKTETVGNGKPLSYQDMEFILGASFVVTEIMNENHVETMRDLNTSEMIEQLHEQFKQIQDERKEFVRKEKADKKAQEKAAAAAAAAEAAKATGGEGEEGEQGVREEVTEEEEEALVEGEEADDLGDALVEDPELDEEKENEEEETAVEEESEGEDGEEEEGGEGELEETDEKQKNLKGIQKNLAKQKRKMEKAQQVLEKTTTSMEKQAGKVLDLEEKIHKLGSYTKYLMALCNAVMTVLDKVMEREIQRILRWPFPPTVTYRVLKGVLHMLGHEKTVYDNWILARQVFGSTFYDELKSYKAFDDTDLSKWKFADKCLDELTDEVLQVEAPVAYLGKEWLLSVKTIMRAGAKHRKLTKIHDDEAQKLADAQLQVLVSDLEIKVLLEEEERMSYSEQRLLAEMEEEKIAKEQAEAKESEQRSEEAGSGGGGDGEEEEEQ